MKQADRSDLQDEIAIKFNFLKKGKCVIKAEQTLAI